MITTLLRLAFKFSDRKARKFKLRQSSASRAIRFRLVSRSMFLFDQEFAQKKLFLQLKTTGNSNENSVFPSHRQA